MKNLIIKLRNKLFIPMCISSIVYFIALEELRRYSIFWILSYILLAIAVFFIIASIFDFSNRKKKIKQQNYKTKNIVDFLHIYSGHIINYSFYAYYITYILCQFYQKSLIFNYLLLASLGMFLGYRIAVNAILFVEEK